MAKCVTEYSLTTTYYDSSSYFQAAITPNTENFIFKKIVSTSSPEYNTNDYDISGIAKEGIKHIYDFSKHLIIVFEQSKNYLPSPDDKPYGVQIDLSYRELHNVIDKISADYRIATGKVPRINLIGQSRGGLLNMMYAINHPYNVVNMYGIGSPTREQNRQS